MNKSHHEYQRNMKQLEDMIKLTIEDTIRKKLPIKEILREHLENANEPKQPQNQLDMKTLVDEIRKATTQVNNDTNTETNYDSNYETEDEDVAVSNNNFSSIFNKEQGDSNNLPTEIDDSPVNNSNNVDNTFTSISNKEDNTYVTPETSPFRDEDDPDEDQIKVATQNIVLNDITEPVVEPSYDNTDIVSPTKSDNNDNKLESMVKELSKVTPPPVAPTVKIDKLNDFNSSTNNSSTNNSSTNNSSTNSSSNNTLATVVKKNES